MTERFSTHDCLPSSLVLLISRVELYSYLEVVYNNGGMSTQVVLYKSPFQPADIT